MSIWTPQPEQPDEEPALTPRPNPILAQPATPALCQADYQDADDIRRRLGWTDTR